MVELQVLQEQKPAMRHTVSGSGYHSMPLTVNGTAMILFIECYLDDLFQFKEYLYENTI